jgi:hypothetical protein
MIAAARLSIDAFDINSIVGFDWSLLLARRLTWPPFRNDNDSCDGRSVVGAQKRERARQYGEVH